MDDTILLDPVLFDALHLSALEFGGIGGGLFYEWRDDKRVGPLCPLSLIAWVGTRLPGSGEDWIARNDERLRATGLDRHRRTPFENWCRLVGVDVAL